MNKLTPMLRHYLEVKSQNPEAILLYRMGDFFEMFFDDAVVAARELDIALTSRSSKGLPEDERIPMAGVPHHAISAYVAKLVERGHRVVICDQVEDASQAKGLVRREVTRIITPGLVLDPEGLEAEAPNYIVALVGEARSLGLAMMDISTGDFRVTEVDSEDALKAELARIQPREILLPQEDQERFMALFPFLTQVFVSPRPAGEFALEEAVASLRRLLEVEDLSSFGIQEGVGVRAAGALAGYVAESQRAQASQVCRLIPYTPADAMVLDDICVTNLELVRTLRSGSRQGSLLGVLDRTVTPMGARALRQWLHYPLINVEAIHRRLDAVEELAEGHANRGRIREGLAKVRDMERLVGRACASVASPRDILSLGTSLAALPGLLELMQASRVAWLRHAWEGMDLVQDLRELLLQALVDEPPASLKDGGVIRPGYDGQLDSIVALSTEGRGYIDHMEERERKATGIGSLKVKFNRVFGYFIEITKANLHLVPERYIRKQTIAGGERFITSELQEYEDTVLHAEERRVERETEIFEGLRGQVAAAASRVQAVAARVAELDALASLGEVACQRDYTRPEVGTDDNISIIEGRHPVVEVVVRDERFVPNDIHLDNGDSQIMILTGPNMAGKSTVMRQAALITIMAQMGSFVPAKEAHIGLVDRIFTRVGASDNLAGGMSTFMVEMVETAHILHRATPKSLLLLDEIGRGTSTFDGLSIAWSVAEYIHEKIGAKTIFATHYHELTDLASTFGRVKNFNIAVREWKEQVIFLRKLVPGGTNRSYGIQVGRLAGLPFEVIERAREILDNLERGELDEEGKPNLARSPRRLRRLDPRQLSLFGGAPVSNMAAPPSALEEALRQINVEVLTPIEALNLLHKLRSKLP